MSVRARAADPASDDERARALYREGAAAFQAGKYPEAHRALRAAWEAKKTYDVAGALAQVEIELGLYRDAAEHLDFCVRNFPARESEERLMQTRKRFESVTVHVTTLTARVTPDGSEVFVDGRSVGVSPLGAPLYLHPGRRTIEARFGGQSVERTIEAVPGAKQSLELEVVESPASAGAPAAAAAAPAPAPAAVPAASTGAASASATLASPEPSSAPSSGKSLVPVYVGGGVALVGLVAGIGYRLAAQSDEEEVDRFRTEFGPSACRDGTATPSECRRWRDAASSVDTNRNLSTAGFVVAGVSLVATAAYVWLWPSRSASEARARAPAPRWSIGASVTASARTAWIGGTY